MTIIQAYFLYYLQKEQDLGMFYAEKSILLQTLCLSILLANDAGLIQSSLDIRVILEMNNNYNLIFLMIRVFVKVLFARICILLIK